jgi:hypothetical protein
VGVGLSEDLAQIAATAAAEGPVAGVVAAEPRPGHRVYLVAYAGEDPEWLAFDAGGTPLDRREEVRDAASIVAMCEVAADTAGGGDLPALRAQITQLKMVENPPGIEEAENAALALEQTVGVPPRVASPAYLDAVGAATFVLERALGEQASPFADTLRSAAGVVDEFVRDVERRYRRTLR